MAIGFLLKEDGCFLLLESGGKILLESSTAFIEGTNIRSESKSSEQKSTSLSMTVDSE